MRIKIKNKVSVLNCTLAKERVSTPNSSNAPQDASFFVGPQTLEGLLNP